MEAGSEQAVGIQMVIRQACRLMKVEMVRNCTPDNDMSLKTSNSAGMQKRYFGRQFVPLAPYSVVQLCTREFSNMSEFGCC